MDLARAARLLHQVFGLRAFDGTDTLRWLYFEGPEGHAICSEHVEEGELLGHYAVVPQTWHSTGGVLPMALAVNLGVDSRRRGRGIFTRLAEEAHARARDQGVTAILAVANANSSPGFRRRLGFRFLRQLPVRVMLRRPRKARDVESVGGRSAFFSSSAFTDLVGRLDLGPRVAWTRQWNEERLRWRLRSPTNTLWLHASQRCALVSCVDRTRGLPFVVVLKVFRAPGASDAELGRVLDAACAVHFTPVVVASGRTKWGGLSLPIPERFKPSPLNVIVRTLDSDRLDPAADVEFEFLDFDAY